jgi:hypothetical protein
MEESKSTPDVDRSVDAKSLHVTNLPLDFNKEELL